MLLFWGTAPSTKPCFRSISVAPSPEVGERILSSEKVRAFSFELKIKDGYGYQVVYDAEFRCYISSAEAFRR